MMLPTLVVYIQFVYGLYAVSNAEVQALIDIYDSTNGDHWRDNTNWIMNDDTCSWYGIQCTEDHIFSIDLSNNGLNGTIPDSIGNLSELQVLHLYGKKNNIYGSLPDSIGLLTKLLIIDISAQNFEGPIPESIGKCTLLNEIDLDNNHFTSIPDSISNLGPLYKLEINDNQMLNVSLPVNGPTFDCDCSDPNPCALNGNVFKYKCRAQCTFLQFHHGVVFAVLFTQATRNMAS